jgi:hypothetical protein
MGEPKKKPAFGRREIIVLVCIIGFVAWVLIPNLIGSKRVPTVSNPVLDAHRCINNLREIQYAKQEWALEKGKTNGVVCTEDDIKPCINLDSKGNLPKCPSGGIYTIGKVGEPPTCSLGKTKPGHVLP